MDREQMIKELSLGGPGHDGYTYAADVMCVECGKKEIRRIVENAPADALGLLDRPRGLPTFPIWMRDSEKMPQPIFFGESDCAQHCCECQRYLYGGDPIIEEGTEYKIVRYPDRKVIFEGVAESDTEAEERLEACALHLRAVLNVPYAVTLKIEKA